MCVARHLAYLIIMLLMMLMLLLVLMLLLLLTTTAAAAVCCILPAMPCIPHHTSFFTNPFVKLNNCIHVGVRKHLLESDMCHPNDGGERQLGFFTWTYA